MISAEGFSKEYQDLIQEVVTKAFEKIESIAGAAMSTKSLDITVINTDLWQKKRSGTGCQACKAQTPHTVYAGKDGIEIHASQDSLSDELDAFIESLYHGCAHVGLLFCDLPKEKWHDAVKNSRGKNDILTIDKTDYLVHRVVLNGNG